MADNLSHGKLTVDLEFLANHSVQATNMGDIMIIDKEGACIANFDCTTSLLDVVIGTLRSIKFQYSDTE